MTKYIAGDGGLLAAGLSGPAKQLSQEESMSTTRKTKVLLPLIAVMAIFGLATPASAAPSPYDVEMTRGQISVGSTNFDTPGATPASCPGSTSISGEIDDTAGTITGELDIVSSDFVLPLFGGTYVLEASSPQGSGTYDPVSETFSGLQLDPISFKIRPINTSDCVTDAPVCSGTAALTASGGLMPGVSLPLGSGDEVFVNGTGSITSVTNCLFPWNLVLSTGQSLTIGANPAYPGDSGAIFEGS